MLADHENHRKPGSPLPPFIAFDFSGSGGTRFDNDIHWFTYRVLQIGLVYSLDNHGTCTTVRLR